MAEFWYSFLSEAVEASQCYFFENRLIKLKCPHLLKVLLSFLKLGSQLLLVIWNFKVCHIELEHPVYKLRKLNPLILTEWEEMQYWGYVIPNWLDLWIVPFLCLDLIRTALDYTFNFLLLKIPFNYLVWSKSKICWECQREDGWPFNFVQIYGRDLLWKWKQKLWKILNKSVEVRP